MRGSHGRTTARDLDRSRVFYYPNSDDFASAGSKVRPEENRAVEETSSHRCELQSGRAKRGRAEDCKAAPQAPDIKAGSILSPILSGVPNTTKQEMIWPKGPPPGPSAWQRQISIFLL